MIGDFNKYLYYGPNVYNLQLLALILFLLICCLTIFNIYKIPRYYYRYMQGLPLEYENTNNEN